MKKFRDLSDEVVLAIDDKRFARVVKDFDSVCPDTDLINQIVNEMTSEDITDLYNYGIVFNIKQIEIFEDDYDYYIKFELKDDSVVDGLTPVFAVKKDSSVILAKYTTMYFGFELTESMRKLF